MKAKASVIAQKLLNLYRQAHVINGGWPVLNRVFLDEASDEVLAALRELPTGKLLVSHINNLRSGKTPMDSIARELLPYGGMMAENEVVQHLTQEELDDLIHAVNAFTPDAKGLDEFMDNPIVARFGSDWANQIRTALPHDSDALSKLDNIVQIANAYKMWESANQILANSVTDRERAQLQVDMPEYETYLPMFGDEGRNLLRRLHTLTSSMPKSMVN